MKILYLHQHFTVPAGSSGTRSYEFARRLIDRGHQVTMVTGAYAGSGVCLKGDDRAISRRGNIDGIDVIQINLPYSNYDGLLRRSVLFLRYAWHSTRLALQEDYDLLFATSTPLTAGIPGIIMKCMRRKPFVFEVRDLWPELPKAMGVIRNPLVLGAMSLLEWLTYRTADACIGLSPGIVEGIRKRSRRKLPLAMIPNSCDLEQFKPGDGSIEGGQDGNANGKKLFRAIFSGAHGVANGLDAVLDAAGVLKKRGRSDIELIMIGDGKLKPDLVRRAEAEGLDNCVFEGLIPKAQLAERLQKANAGLMILANVPAFYFGTSPNKFFDYIAAGLPVVNNYPGWLAGLITEHGCGIAVPPEDPEAFADALERLADNPDEVQSMKQNARALAESKFDRNRLGGEFVDFLENIGYRRS